MKCPHCGAEMNHHADKLFPTEVSELTEPVFGAKILELHSCPACGSAASRMGEEAF
jgi:NMD protein affecting ribosome stability and mRNA decay